MAGLIRFLCVMIAILGMASPACAFDRSSKDFNDWIEGVRLDAIREGISEATLADALDHAETIARVVELDKKQPEKTITFEEYVRGVVTPARIREGERLREENAPNLNKVSEQYGVPVGIIIALWGVESSFGRHPGNFSVIDSLVTLAYEGRRSQFFRKELLASLHILDEEHIPAQSLRGSWAGAMGQCQFMPSTYLHYAADQDEDGHRDIWKNDDDVFASIANYIVAEGWGKSIGWGNEVTLKDPVPPEEIGLTFERSIKQWQEMGVVITGGELKDDPDSPASLIQPDGAGGRSFLVYDNFRALMKWNRSTYFATSVGLFADRIH